MLRKRSRVRFSQEALKPPHFRRGDWWLSPGSVLSRRAKLIAKLGYEYQVPQRRQHCGSPRSELGDGSPYWDYLYRRDDDLLISEFDGDKRHEQALATRQQLRPERRRQHFGRRRREMAHRVLDDTRRARQLIGGIPRVSYRSSFAERSLTAAPRPALSILFGYCSRRPVSVTTEPRSSKSTSVPHRLFGRSPST